MKAALYQVLGAALLTPAGVVLGMAVLSEQTLARILMLWAACLPASVLLAMAPLVRRIEIAALAELLEVEVSDKADRVYLVALTSLHLYGGATLGAGVLMLLPGLIWLGDLTQWRDDPAVLAEPLAIAVALGAAMVAAGSGQRWAARRLLRAEPSRMLEELGRRQTLALELHDAVGHALSVVLVQGMVAQAALQRPDPGLEEATRSTEHLLDTARAAQEELDVLLGVLDDGEMSRTPTLDSLDTLTRGLDVRVSAGHLGRIPAATSRTAYAIAREALTNALRHGSGPITLDVAVAGELVLTVENATADVSSPPAGHRRGLTGMRMRARLAGGTCTLQQADATWRVQARLPL
ncbi:MULTISPECIES: sensor histidine kinase [Streptosporangium]|uniref:histidine kinase n=1 Tax=Streptosporangium brasiliense TaxID=47480 RepID=A0ABT9QYG7_9ACTN|nr:histidine kinase [Streptosporangium brasiliense]MDP9862020.1 signal transduction histidine kinase [Streptosporangium brasiliense]